MSKHRPNGFSALFSGLKAALQWRPLLWWALALCLPALLATLPMWAGLNAQFAHSAHAADIAAGRDLPLLLDGFGALSKGGAQAVGSGAIAAIAVALLLSPWLTGMVVASQRAGRRLKLGELAHGGLAEYWRMFRLLLWSLLPLGVAVGLGAVALGAADKLTEQAILESEVARAGNVALAVAALLFVYAHATIEAARGWLGAEPGLRSIFRAWWRGLKLVLRRPLATLIVYVGSSAAGYVLAALFGWWRLRSDGAGIGAFLLGLLLTQLVVVALAWGRIARLHGFNALARGRIGEKAAEPIEVEPSAQSGSDSSDSETTTPLPSA
ncbi:MAG: hypothetical protein QM761_07110 [Pseudoxanthomonas sp.]